jgi:hypothetical protein
LEVSLGDPLRWLSDYARRAENNAAGELGDFGVALSALSHKGDASLVRMAGALLRASVSKELVDDSGSLPENTAAQSQRAESRRLSFALGALLLEALALDAAAAVLKAEGKEDAVLAAEKHAESMACRLAGGLLNKAASEIEADKLASPLAENEMEAAR